MFLPRDEFCYLLVDAAYNVYFFENGVLKKQPLPAFHNTANKFYLPQHPDGWQNLTISFATNNNFWMLNRSFTVPLNFITTGAEILRTLRYKGKGFSEIVYVLLLRRDRYATPERYTAEYYGQIDMSKASDDPLRGITVNTIEGGLFSFFNANVNTTYDIPCDESVPDVLTVLDDGQTLNDKYNYQVVETIDMVQPGGTATAVLPAVFINNEGDSVGVVRGDPTYENTGVEDTYVTTSANYIWYSIYGVSNLRLTGYLVINDDSGHTGTSSVSDYFGLKYKTSLGNEGILAPVILRNYGDVIYFDSGFTIDLQPNEKMFITIFSTLGALSISTGRGNFSIEFNSRNTTTTLFARRPIAVGQALLDKMTNTTGVYKLVSTLLTEDDKVCLTCGDAIRQTLHTVVPIYYMSLSLSDWYSLYNAIYDCGFKIVGNTLYFEKKSVLSDIAGGVIFDLGEVAKVTIDTAEDLLANLFLCGYPDQTYDQNAGKYEYNSNQEYGLPTTATQNKLDITSKIRADARGIEAIRGALLQNKDTTDNSGDKQPFAIDISDTPVTQNFSAGQAVAQTYTGQSWIVFDNFTNGALVNFEWAANHYIFNYIQQYQVANIKLSLVVDNGSHEIQAFLFKNGQSIATYQGTDTNGTTAINLNVDNVTFNYNDNLEIRIIPIDVSAQTFTVNAANLNVYFLIPVYPLYRETYTALSGVLDNTIYNARISPHAQLRNWGGYFKSLFYQQQTDQIIFNTGKKNVLFSRTVNGVTITENANETIGNLPGTPYFIPYIVNVLYKVPYTFVQQMSMMQAGYITMTFNGIRINVLPLGSSSSKPMTSEPQQGKFLLAANNDITTLLLLNQFSLTIINGQYFMHISDYNPVHFVKYDYITPTGFRYKDIYDDWVHKRFPSFQTSEETLFRQGVQKWLPTDTIKFQVYGNGLGALQLFVYDSKTGKEVSTTPFTVVVNSAVDPNVQLYQLAITMPLGLYYFVIKDGDGNNLAISEFQDVRTSHPKTFAFDYSNSYNKFNFFFNSIGQIRKRIDAQLAPEDPDADYTSYQDEEGDATIVRGLTIPKQILEIGSPAGIPDYDARKMDMITLLDAWQIEGIPYTRASDSKIENHGFRVGYPYSYYKLTVQKSTNELGLNIITDQDVTDGLATSFIVDPQAIGMNDADNLIIEIKNT